MLVPDLNGQHFTVCAMLFLSFVVLSSQSIVLMLNPVSSYMSSPRYCCGVPIVFDIILWLRDDLFRTGNIKILLGSIGLPDFRVFPTYSSELLTKIAKGKTKIFQFFPFLVCSVSKAALVTGCSIAIWLRESFALILECFGIRNSYSQYIERIPFVHRASSFWPPVETMVPNNSAR